MARNFMELLRARWAEGKFVCVGLDTDIRKIPQWFREGAEGRDALGTPAESAQAVLQYNLHLIDATKDLVCAYKPNSAFYEALGTEGIRALTITCEYIRKTAPDVPIILDVKRGDIGSSSEGYQKFAFDRIQADAATVNPYMGQDALQPFLDREDKGVIVLCRTSNPGAAEFQDLPVTVDEGRFEEIYQGTPVGGDGDTFSMPKQMPLWEYVARRVSTCWNANDNCLLVAGATGPEELAKIREIVGDLPLLIPGVGKQGADVEAAVKAGIDSNGEGIIVNSSRGIIFASEGEDFPAVAAAKTAKLNDEINEHRAVPA